MVDRGDNFNDIAVERLVSAPHGRRHCRLGAINTYYNRLCGVISNHVVSLELFRLVRAHPHNRLGE